MGDLELCLFTPLLYPSCQPKVFSMKGAQCAILGDLNEVLSFSFHTDVSLNCSRSMVNYLAEQGTLSRPQGAADNHTGFSKALNTD